MATTVNPPRGMRDFLPAEKKRREHALRVIRDVFNAHGFDEIETPVMEDSATLHGGLGGDNEKLGFAVMRRGLETVDLSAAAESGNYLALADLGLRFDLTVPLARFYASHRSELPPVFRSIHIAPVWRAERPQKGRFRQFVQCDIDVIGESTALAERELFTATGEVLERLGLIGCFIRVNDRRLLTAVLDSWDVPADERTRDRALITLDKLDKIGVEKVAEELAGLGINKSGIAADIEQLGKATWDSVTSGGLQNLDGSVFRELLELRETLPSFDIRFDPTLVRGMGYYTGTIFEISHPEFGYSLGGGGRYDNMIGRFLGESVPACGFSIGFERIVELIAVKNSDLPHAVVLVYDADVDPSRLIALKSELVSTGHRVRLEHTVKNTRALLERLAREGFQSFTSVTTRTSSVSDLNFRDLEPAS